jgi:hypothetical protein
MILGNGAAAATGLFVVSGAGRFCILEGVTGDFGTSVPDAIGGALPVAAAAEVGVAGAVIPVAPDGVCPAGPEIEFCFCFGRGGTPAAAPTISRNMTLS